ncbi:hypothetical protein LshimejAT787_0506130 [Lyophyllum shimeji]|uniref:Uncharacterized protein n=1 Tax=Lyophyllum shimeji TaxID=47721 RepID=A0A9P3PNM1_LYOSH|nr:hypothetical protein LshimejAT787_0506130 [Lyophyllum shimeji]
MPTTRRQSTLKSKTENAEDVIKSNSHAKRAKPQSAEAKEPPEKKAKTEETEEAEEAEEEAPEKPKFTTGKKYEWQPGTIERGHIYFFYRPKVQVEQAQSIDDIKNFHMLLVPRPPEFSVPEKRGSKSGKQEDEMKVMEPGADAVPAPEPTNQPKKRFRLITVGKKHLPDPEMGGAGQGRKEMFWATVTEVGEDLHHLEEGLGTKEYETMTRGARKNEANRLAARGAYAIVNTEDTVPSHRETHFGYYVSHPDEPGEVQEELGIGKASSFVMQVKNPEAPTTAGARISGKGPEYPEEIMRDVFGKGGARGRESYGLRFTACATPELLDYKHAQILLIAARGGEEGLDTSLGEGRGKAMADHEEKEKNEPIEQIFQELDADIKAYPAEPLKGEWI